MVKVVLEFETEGEEVVGKIVDYHLRHTGVSRFEKFEHFYSNILNRPLNEETLKNLCKRFSELVVDEVVNAPFVNGALELLENQSKLFKCFIASATPQDELEEIVRHRDISNHFIRIYGSPKKKTDIVRDILSIHKLLPDDVAYIGDAMSDYEAARANSAIFIARINDNESIFDNMDCLKVKDLVNLKAILDTL